MKPSLALGSLRGPGVADSLVDVLGDRDPLIRAAAAPIRVAVDPEDFVTILSGLDPDPTGASAPRSRRSSVTLPGRRALPRLTRMLDDTDQRVIAAVLAALVKIGAPNAGDILLDHLKADDPVVRAAAASGIGELRLPAGAQALPAAYQFGLRDATYVARAAAIEALSKYGISVARSLLDAALADKDWAVRVRAAALLKQASRRATPTIAFGRRRPGWRPKAIEPPRLTNPPVSTQAYHRHRSRDDPDRAGRARCAADGRELHHACARGFFNGLTFHRVVPDFVVQAGDPRGDGEGGPGYTIRDEINERPYLRGTVGMALDWADTGGSQFFITHSPQPHLDAKYTVFGRVIAGMDVVDKIQQGDVIRRVRVWDGQQMLDAAPN